MSGAPPPVVSMLQRIINSFPTNWFPSGQADEKGNIYRYVGQAAGSAAVFSQVYAQIQFLNAQLRIQTSSGGFLDLSSRDYFGTGLQRHAGESDANFATRIVANFFQPQNTYSAMVQVLQTLTGNTPSIVRSRRPADLGAYRSAPLAYSFSGAYGSLLLPYQAGITIKRPVRSGIANIQGYGTLSVPASQHWGGGGYKQGLIQYADLSMLTGGVSDQDIYDAVLATKLEGTKVWVRLIN
jgi:hypothetical protein